MLATITENEIVFNSERGSCETVTVYALPDDTKIHKKVWSYKTARGLLAYCEKNLTLVSHFDPLESVPEISPTVTTDNKTLPDDGSSALGVVDNSEGEALLPVQSPTSLVSTDIVNGSLAGESLLKSELEQLGYDLSKPKIYAPVNGLGIQVSFFPNKVMGFVFNVVNGVRQDSTEWAYNMSYAHLREVFNASSPSEVIGLFKLHEIVKPYPKRKKDDPANYRHEVAYPPVDDDIPPLYGLGV